MLKTKFNHMNSNDISQLHVVFVSSRYSPSVPLFISRFFSYQVVFIRIEMLVLGSSLSATRRLEVVPVNPRNGNPSLAN